MCLNTSGNYTHVEILTAGTVEKNSSTIKSSGRNRTIINILLMTILGFSVFKIQVKLEIK